MLEPSSNNTLRAAEIALISSNTDGYRVAETGEIYGQYIFTSGLWLATVRDGAPASNIIWCGSYPLTNYKSMLNGSVSGLYKITKNNLPADDYLKSLGIPTNSDGTIKLFGDETIFSVQTENTSLLSLPIFSTPLKNVSVSQLVWSYKRSDIKDVIFIRYGIKNNTNTTLTFNSGYYSDTDLWYSSNSVAYDSARGFSYTYDSATAVGFAFLKAPAMESGQPKILSHRIVRKNNYINPNFGEIGFTNSQQVIWALNGLDNFGNPMVNPITNKITKYAFTGNPVDSTGWLDTRVDVRNLLSIESFSVAPSETKYFTLAILKSKSDSKKNAILQILKQLDLIREQTNLWDY
ncbi:MAG: hypothetical protein Q8S39_03970 [Ignavibacteria bacterium]|nr:hypothetical protein [Ignavibacteria bacterium]